MKKIEAVIPDEFEKKVTLALTEAASTGRIGDGKIFVLPTHRGGEAPRT